jgi:hypothetical protein
LAVGQQAAVTQEVERPEVAAQLDQQAVLAVEQQLAEL